MPTRDRGARRVRGWPRALPERGLVVVVGANGSGKSTVLLALAGLLPAPEAPPIPTPIGLLLQDAEAGWLASTVGEEVRFGLDDAGDLAPLLRDLGIDGHEHRDPRDLSSGEQQRVQLAAVLARRPRTLLVDEPTAHLDPGSSAGVWKAIARAGGWGCDLVVCATTELEDAIDADRVLVTRGCEIVADEPPDRLVRRDVTAWGLHPTDAMRAAAEWDIAPAIGFDGWEST